MKKLVHSEVKMNNKLMTQAVVGINWICFFTIISFSLTFRAISVFIVIIQNERLLR